MTDNGSAMTSISLTPLLRASTAYHGLERAVTAFEMHARSVRPSPVFDAVDTMAKLEALSTRLSRLGSDLLIQAELARDLCPYCGHPVEDGSDYCSPQHRIAAEQDQ